MTFKLGLSAVMELANHWTGPNSAAPLKPGYLPLASVLLATPSRAKIPVTKEQWMRS